MLRERDEYKELLVIDTLIIMSENSVGERN